MEKRSRNCEKRKASSLEPKSPSASDFAAGKPYRGVLAEKDEKQEDQHKRQRTEDLRSVPDSHLGVSHPNTRLEGPTSHERQPDWTEYEPPFFKLMRKCDEVAKASSKVAQDRWLNVLFTEKEANALREEFSRIALANEDGHASCLKARGDSLMYKRASDKVIAKVDEQLSKVHDTYNQAIDNLTRTLNANLQELLPQELLSQGVFPKKYPEELETYIKDHLEAILSNKEVSQKRCCRFIKSIGETDDKEVVPCLVRKLGDQRINRYVRESIAEAIGKLGDEEVVPRLVEMLGDQGINRGVRCRIADAIGKLGNEKVVPCLVPMLGDEKIDLDVREGIVRAIGKLGDQDVAPRLVEILGDERINKYVRESIVKAIGKLGDEKVALRLVEMLGDDEINKYVRCHIANAIGKLGDKKVVPRLVKMLGDDEIDLDVRYHIADAIGKLGDKKVVPRLVEKLGDDEIDLDVRCHIADAIGKLGDKKVVPRLVEMLGDEKIDLDVRCSIADAIGKLDDKEVVPCLVERLRDQRIDWEVRCRILKLIGELGDKEGSTILSQDAS